MGNACCNQQEEHQHHLHSKITHKHIFQQKYQTILQLARSQNITWEDPIFPPNSQSLGQIPIQGLHWRRLSQLYPLGKFILNGISPTDISKDQDNSSYFLSVIAAFAEKDKQMKNILIYSHEEINKYCVYGVNLMVSGVRKEMVVDDFVPVNSNGKPIFISAIDGEIWPLIIQKAYAKLKGSYANILQSNIEQPMLALSMGPVKSYAIGKTTQDIINQKIWNKIQDKLSHTVAILETNNQQINHVGLVPNHSYTLLSTFKVRDQQDNSNYKLCKLRNPSSTKEWMGRFSDKDKKSWDKLSSEALKNIGYQDKDDGIFFMQWQQVIHHFSSIVMSEIHPQFKYISKFLKLNTKHAQYYEIQIEQHGLYFLSIYKFAQEKIDEITIKFVVAMKNQSVKQNGRNCNYIVCPFYKAGKYVAYVKASLKKPIPLNVTFGCYGIKQPKFYPAKRNDYNKRFLNEVFTDYMLNKSTEKQIIINDQQKQWIKSQMSDKTANYGLILFNLQYAASIDINKGQFDKDWILKKPVKKNKVIKGNLKVNIPAKQNYLMIVASKPFSKKLQFPPQGFKILL